MKTNSQITPEIAKANEAKRQARTFSNYVTTARGTRTIINEDDKVTFGFTNLAIWNPKTQSWTPLSPNDNDKFLVTCDDFTTACTEFWARWKIYVQRRFNLPYIKIESTNY